MIPVVPSIRTALRRGVFAAGGLTILSSTAAWAADAPPVVDTGDTAWVLTASALVLMMTLPGLALFYGGLVRAKNILNVLMQCMLSAGIIGVLWILVGYSLAFGTGNAWVGDFSKAGLAGVTIDSVTANFATPPRNIPEYVFIMFQAMFAIITPALILGAIAERMRFSVWVAFITVWFLVVYCPIAHMVWAAEGWIYKAGAIDFAGGLVVHMSSGFSAIAPRIRAGVMIANIAWNMMKTYSGMLRGGVAKFVVTESIVTPARPALEKSPTHAFPVPNARL